MKAAARWMTTLPGVQDCPVMPSMTGKGTFCLALGKPGILP